MVVFFIKPWDSYLALSNPEAIMTYEADIEFAQEAAYEIDADWLRSKFSSRYGRGWQSKLANSLGIAQSTLSTWLKNNDIPVWAKLAIAALTLRDEGMRELTRRVVRDGECFAIYDYEQSVGVRIADGIMSSKDAFLFAAAKELFDACGEAATVLENADIDGLEEIRDRLENAYQIARVGYDIASNDSPDVDEKADAP